MSNDLNTLLGGDYLDPNQTAKITTTLKPSKFILDLALAYVNLLDEETLRISDHRYTTFETANVFIQQDVVKAVDDLTTTEFMGKLLAVEGVEDLIR
jgi:hypothetical protein